MYLTYLVHFGVLHSKTRWEFSVIFMRAWEDSKNSEVRFKHITLNTSNYNSKGR